MDVRSISIGVASRVALQGDLAIPDRARATVLFAHGSGSGRHSPRNRYVAQVLQRSGFATLLVDLLTYAEEEAERYTSHLRFDIELLAKRLIGVTRWIRQEPLVRTMPIGYFGASTGAAAALQAAVNAPKDVCAVVSRGGRPDLVGDALARVRAPTLLIVGAADTQVLELNRRALGLLVTEKKLEVVPGATHLFEEPGSLERVAELSARWFTGHLNDR